MEVYEQFGERESENETREGKHWRPHPLSLSLSKGNEKRELSFRRVSVMLEVLEEAAIRNNNSSSSCPPCRGGIPSPKLQGIVAGRVEQQRCNTVARRYSIRAINYNHKLQSRIVSAFSLGMSQFRVRGGGGEERRGEETSSAREGKGREGRWEERGERNELLVPPLMNLQ